MRDSGAANGGHKMTRQTIRRIGRWTFDAAAVMSLVLCVGIAVLRTRSEQWEETVHIGPWVEDVQFSSGCGVALVAWGMGHGYEDPAWWRYSKFPTSSVYPEPPPPLPWQAFPRWEQNLWRAGFRRQSHFLAVPHWFLC